MVNPEVRPPAVEGRQERRLRAARPPRGPDDPLELLLAGIEDLAPVDAAVILVADPERKCIEPAAQWFASQAMRDAIGPTLSYQYDGEGPGLAEMALQRGRPLLLPCIEDWEAAPTLLARFRRQAGSEPASRVWEVFGRASLIACPVRTPMGQSLGALVVASADRERPLRKEHLRLIEVLSDLAALALERSHLLATEAARGRQEVLLKRASEAMSGSLESEEVYAGAVEHAVRLSGADRGLLSRPVPGGTRLVGVAGSWPASEMGSDAAVVGEVARTRTARVRETAPTAMHVPVALGPRLFGVLSVARDEGPSFDDEMLDLLGRLARIAAAAVANAIDFERERRIARALTRGFVPESLPEAPEYELGLLYEPAGSNSTGGDLYGVWSLPSGQVALLVGDVTGKGVETAALSAMTRFFIEARSWDCDGPGQMLAQANTLLGSRLPDDSFVTAFLALLAPDCVHYANAGHLPPVVLRAEGRLEEAGIQGLPLGIEESSRYEDHRLEFAPGDLMVGFTDGLVEARRTGELFGTERLGEAIVKASGIAPDLNLLVRLLYDDVDAWAGGLSDDAVALAVRRQ